MPTDLNLKLKAYFVTNFYLIIIHWAKLLIAQNNI